MDKKELEVIEEKANNITDKYLLHNKENGYVDIIKIAQDMGFLIGNAKLSDDSDGFIIIDEKKDEILGLPTNKLIGVNANRSLGWKRFIIAHEIGHYILHFIDNAVKLDGLYAHREHITGKDEEENKADFFAACLLMPKNIFSREFKQKKAENEKCEKWEIAALLAKDFCVTETMALRRIDELGLYLNE